MRRELLGPAGPWVVRLLCGYELVALAPRSPLPTISTVVRRHPPVGVLLLGLLAQHWFLEAN